MSEGEREGLEGIEGGKRNGKESEREGKGREEREGGRERDSWFIGYIIFYLKEQLSLT